MKINSKYKKINQRSLVLVVFVLVFGGIGAWQIIKSFAAVSSTPSVSIYNVSSVSALGQNNVFSWTDTVSNIGLQTVIDVESGGKLTFVTGGKESPNTICYFAKVYNSPKSSPAGTPATGTFVGMGSSKSVTLPDDNNYHEICVAPGRKAQLPFHVHNTSNGPAIIISQAVFKY